MNSALTTSEFICTLSCFSASRRFGFVRVVEEDEDGILIERVSFESFTYDCVYDVLHDGWRSMHIRTPVPLPISASPCRAVRSKESCLCALHWPITVCKLLLRATCPASLRPSALLCCAAAWSECSLIGVVTTTAAPERGNIVVFTSTQVFIVIRGKHNARSSQVEGLGFRV